MENIVLVYGDHEFLIAKPANYASLMHEACTIFPDLNEVSDRITFYFRPQWLDREVLLWDSAFAEVHNRAELRILIAADAPAQHPEDDSTNSHDDDATDTGYDMYLGVIHVPTDVKIWVPARAQERLQPLLRKAARFFGVCLEDHDCAYGQFYLSRGDTVESIGITSGDVIEMRS